MNKYKKRLRIVGMVIITMVVCYMLAKRTVRKRIEMNMQISDSSVIEVYHV